VVTMMMCRVGKCCTTATKILSRRSAVVAPTDEIAKEGHGVPTGMMVLKS
jgi:hypothetical protein